MLLFCLLVTTKAIWNCCRQFLLHLLNVAPHSHCPIRCFSPIDHTLSLGSPIVSASPAPCPYPCWEEAWGMTKPTPCNPVNEVRADTQHMASQSSRGAPTTPTLLNTLHCAHADESSGLCPRRTKCRLRHAYEFLGAPPESRPWHDQNYLPAVVASCAAKWWLWASSAMVACIHALPEGSGGTGGPAFATTALGIRRRLRQQASWVPPTAQRAARTPISGRAVGHAAPLRQ